MLMRIAPCGYSQNRFGAVLAQLINNKVSANTRLDGPIKNVGWLIRLIAQSINAICYIIGDQQTAIW